MCPRAELKEFVGRHKVGNWRTGWCGTDSQGQGRAATKGARFPPATIALRDLNFARVTTTNFSGGIQNFEEVHYLRSKFGEGTNYSIDDDGVCDGVMGMAWRHGHPIVVIPNVTLG